MPVTRDIAIYDQLHSRLLRDMLLAIKDELDAADLDHDVVHDLTARIGIAVTSVIDGSAPVELAGEHMQPFLAFSSESHRDHLIVNEQGSYLHELVDSLFEDMSADYEDDEEEEEDDDEDEEDDDEEQDDEDEDDFDYEEDDAEDEDEDEDEEDNGRRH
jgi:hypothetical protein